MTADTDNDVKTFKKINWRLQLSLTGTTRSKRKKSLQQDIKIFAQTPILLSNLFKKYVW